MTWESGKRLNVPEMVVILGIGILLYVVRSHREPNMPGGVKTVNLDIEAADDDTNNDEVDE